jgi:hypothetical protein
VRGTDVGSSYAIPLRVIPEKGKVGKDSVEAASSEGGNVFHDDVAGSNLADQARVLRPEARPRPFDACALAGEADVLAGEPSADDIDVRDGSGSDIPDIRHAKHVRPVLRKNSLTVRVDL